MVHWLLLGTNCSSTCSWWQHAARKSTVLHHCGCVACILTSFLVCPRDACTASCQPVSIAIGAILTGAQKLRKSRNQQPTTKSGKKSNWKVKTNKLRSTGKRSRKSVESVMKKKGYGGKDLQKRKVFSRDKGVVDDESMEPIEEVPLIGLNDSDLEWIWRFGGCDLLAWVRRSSVTAPNKSDESKPYLYRLWWQRVRTFHLHMLKHMHEVARSFLPAEPGLRRYGLPVAYTHSLSERNKNRIYLFYVYGNKCQ